VPLSKSVVRRDKDDELLASRDIALSTIFRVGLCGGVDFQINFSQRMASGRDESGIQPEYRNDAS
jgi:hypothetical protein